MRLLFIAMLLIAMSSALTTHSQLAVKTNLLYDATTTPNLGAEVRVGSKSTINLVYGLNAWSFKGDSKVKHWLVMPEYRWWTCTPFSGHFFGVHLLGGQMNAGNVNLPIPGFWFAGDNLTTGTRDHRYQGVYAGGGITYGYQYPLSEHWNLEAEIGAGYGHVWYDKFQCGHCGEKLSKGGTNYLGITKIGLSLMYIF